MKDQKIEYKDHVIELNEYTHPDFKFQCTHKDDTDGNVSHFKTIEAAKNEIDFQEEKSNAMFVNHSSHPTCDLGAFWYQCPCCGNWIADYDIWWIEESIRNVSAHRFKCKKCESKLIVVFCEKDDEFSVNKVQ